MATATKTKDTVEPIVIGRIPSARILIPITGISPLIVHSFSQKARIQMLEAQQGKKRIKEIRDPEAEYHGSLYLLPEREEGVERYGFPVTGVKAAIVDATRFYNDKRLTKTGLKSMIFLTGEPGETDRQDMIEIHGEPRMREDMVRLGGISRSADLRYRAEFTEWSSMLDITYLRSMIDRDSLVNLVQAAGEFIGIGEWRPQRGGGYGRFIIDEDREIQEIV